MFKKVSQELDKKIMKAIADYFSANWYESSFNLYSFVQSIMFIPPKPSGNFVIPVILEIGSLNTRAGFAGKDRPDSIVPSVNKSVDTVHFHQQNHQLKTLNGLFWF